MDPLELLVEIKRRQHVRAHAPVFLDPEFKSQTDFILDPAKFKAALCTRRSGKSYGAGCYLYKEAWENPGVTCLYIALTLGSAVNIMWRPVLKEINRKLDLGLKEKEHFNNSAHEIRLPNGSLIKLVGADASQEEMQKLLGQKYKLVIIDECASFKQDLTDLIHKVLEPAVMDQSGTICMIGTPSNLKTGIFFRVTSSPPDLKDEDAPWAVHRWGQRDNPYMRDLYDADLEKKLVERPRFLETANYKQMWLGQWSIEDDKLVYRYEAAKNSYEKLPVGRYRTVLGVDLGFGDDSAFVLCTYQPYDPVLYVVESFSAPGMTITKVAETIKQYEKRFSIDSIVIDGANKQAVEEMRQHHGLTHLEAADKKHKFEFIDLLNDDLLQARIKLHTECTNLASELSELVLDEKLLARSGKRAEHPGCSNHLCDALLYAWRHTYQFLAQTAPVVPKQGTPEWLKAQEELWEQEAMRAHPAPQPAYGGDAFPEF